MRHTVCPLTQKLDDKLVIRQSYGGAKVPMTENTVAIHVVKIFYGVGMGKLIIFNAKKALVNIAIN
eukprot:523969-Prorocentrum_minimum.AAC.1